MILYRCGVVRTYWALKLLAEPKILRMSPMVQGRHPFIRVEPPMFIVESKAIGSASKSPG